MLNIVIPMAGRGNRFATAGYALPKPLIAVHGVPMIEVVVNNLRPGTDHRFVFLCLREHDEKLGVTDTLRAIAPNCEIVIVDQVTEGPACSVLLAKHLIDDGNPLMIANSDQWVDITIDDYLDRISEEKLDGLIMTMRADDPKWSYVRLDSQKSITEVVEKQVVSNEATVGIYNYTRGCDFVWAATAMISKGQRVNNEFYVAPAYNHLLQSGKRISYYNVGSVGAGMYGLGIPADLDDFLTRPISHDAVRGCSETGQRPHRLRASA